MRQLVDSTQIDQWFISGRRDAQELLPHLIRRLIAATVDSESIKAMRIPVGDDINKPGFDGVVEVGSGNRYIPNDLSVWEMGTGDAADKAEKDYRSRTNTPRGIVTHDATFVFVTPHSWAGKDDWRAAKRNEGKWKDVHVIDSTDLSAWLEVAPGVARWIARQMGVPIEGLLDLELFWREFQATYGFDIPAGLVIGGRNDAAASFDKWVLAGSSEVVIEGESVEEVAAFTAAATLAADPPKRDWLVSRMLYVQRPESLDFISGIPSTHFVVPLTTEARRRAKAVQSKGMRLILPTVRTAGSGGHSDGAIRLGTIRRSSCEQSLAESGTSEQRSRRIARECKGSLTAALWMVAHGPDTPLPWTEGEAAVDLAPLLLAGQWIADSKSDQSAVEKLAGRGYDQIQRIIAQWQVPNGPLTKRSAIWDWVAADYAWNCLCHSIDRELLSRFRGVVLEVLGSPDPKLELPPDQRWAAAIYKKTHQFSTDLRSGIVGSLVQLSLHEGDVPAGGGLVANVISDLLTGKTSPRAVAWPSLAPWLPDMAEAAPVPFLAAVDDLIGDADAVASLFVEGGMLGFSPHVYLLWALERLAWFELLFSRVVTALGDLAAVDPGGNLHNRPINSLAEIFLPWHPQGAVGVAGRLDAIDLLYAKRPEVTWHLCVSLLPGRAEFASPIADPQWHEWKPAQEKHVMERDYWDFVDGVCRRMMSWAGSSGPRWAAMIEAYGRLQKDRPELAAAVLTSMQRLDPRQFSAEDRLEVSEALRKLITHHQEFAEEKWAVSASQLKLLEDLRSVFLPQDLTQRHKWLFEGWPTLPRERQMSVEEMRRTVELAQTEAVQEILQAQGLDGVLRLADLVESPEAVGFAMSRLNVEPHVEADLLTHSLGTEPLKSKVPPRLRFGLRYVGGCFRREGDQWLNRVRSLPGMKWDANMQANLGWGLPDAGPTWDRLQIWGEEVAKLYWSRVPLDIVHDEARDAERAVRGLLDAGRPYRAIYVAGWCAMRDKKGTEASHLSREVIVRALSEAPKHDPNAEWYPPALGTLAHHIERLLDLVQRLGLPTAELAQLEWAWLAALEHGKRGPKALQEMLSADPSLFIQALKLVYRAEGEAPRDADENERARATQAYRLLNNWTRVPGTVALVPASNPAEGDIPFDGGEVDGQQLVSWVEQARAAAKDGGRLGVCDSQVGQTLAYAPTDPDGTWPCESVRNVIEKVASEDLEHGISIGVYNKRGGFSRSQGGEQERRLVKKFRGYAQQTRSRWPRTTSVLDDIANQYEREAKREDARAAFEEFE